MRYANVRYSPASRCTVRNDARSISDNPVGDRSTSLIWASQSARRRHFSSSKSESADIPCFSKSSAGLEMGPGGGLVVGAAGLQAAMEDADEAVADLAQSGLMAGATLT